MTLIPFSKTINFAKGLTNTYIKINKIHYKLVKIFIPRQIKLNSIKELIFEENYNIPFSILCHIAKKYYNENYLVISINKNKKLGINNIYSVPIKLVAEDSFEYVIQYFDKKLHPNYNFQYSKFELNSLISNTGFLVQSNEQIINSKVKLLRNGIFWSRRHSIYLENTLKYVLPVEIISLIEEFCWTEIWPQYLYWVDSNCGEYLIEDIDPSNIFKTMGSNTIIYSIFRQSRAFFVALNYNVLRIMSGMGGLAYA